MRPLTTNCAWAVATLGAFIIGLSGKSSPQREATQPESRRSPITALKPGVGTVTGATGDQESAASGRGTLVGAVFAGSALDRASLEELARQAVRDPNPIARRLAFGRLLESLDAENALAIREQLVAFGARGSEWDDFNYSWGALAGEEAVIFAASSKEKDMDAALRGWASSSPADAIAFLDNLPESMRGGRGDLAASVVAGLADREPGLATDLVFRLADEGVGGGEKLMELVANQALRLSSVEQAAAWSETIPDGALKAAAMDRVADAFVKSDPEAAAEWAEGFADQDYASRVIEEVGDGWAERDPVAAVSWLESLPAGEGQIAGLSSAFGDWEDRDPLAASEYLLGMPQSEQRDFAISGFSRGYAWQDPEAAIAWAEDIGDPELRQETLARAGQAYLRRDPDSAREWLQTSGLPAEVQTKLLDSSRRR